MTLETYIQVILVIVLMLIPVLCALSFLAGSVYGLWDRRDMDDDTLAGSRASERATTSGRQPIR